MKKISAVMMMGLFLLLTIIRANAQQTIKVDMSSVEPYKLEINYWKTTSIVFPYAIISVDRGSRDVLAQKAKGVENILQIKAAKDTIQETNLTVITADGKLSAFNLKYANQPSALNYSIVDNAPKNSIFLSPETINQQEVQDYADKAALQKKSLGGYNEKEFGVKFQLTGFFVHSDLIYCRIKIQNLSNIDYDIEQLRFFIRDKKKAKRTAIQEIEVLPVYSQGDKDKIESATDNTIVFALPKFTIPDKKYLAIQLIEKNGGRHLELYVKNKSILKASILN